MAKSSTFAADITKFCDRTKVKGALVVKKLAFDGLRGVLLRSPVDTGRFRANWRIGFGGPDLSVDVKLTGPKRPASHGSATYSFAGGGYKASGAEDTATLAAGNNKLTATKWGDSIWITNNVVYALSLEYGHSKQAPAGVLGVTYEEIRASFARTVASIK